LNFDKPFLEENVKACYSLFEIFKKYDSEVYDLEKTKDGNYTFRLNNIYFHSKYAPVKEAERIFDLVFGDEDIPDVIILFGNGLGFLARIIYERLIKKNTNALKPYLLYVEKDLKTFFTALSSYDFRDLLKDENVKFFLDSEKEIIGSFIQGVPTKKVRYYYHRPSFVQNEDYYKNLQNYITYVLDRKDMNSATLKRFQKLWTKNFINNLPFLLRARGVKELANIAPGVTSIVVAGGPTLEKSLNFIKENQKKCIIIAVDTVYKFLKKNGIRVDIIVTVDPQYWNYKYLENIKIDNEIIVTDSSTYYKIFYLTTPERFFVPNSIFEIAKYFEKREKGVLSAGGSVATTAFDIARVIGSSSIILTGLDLSFPERKTHFKGAFFEINFLTFSTYFNSAEDNAYRYLTHADLIKVKSTNGFVFTDCKMTLFKKWFDREIPLTNAKVYLPDFGGVFIEGTILCSLDKLQVDSSKEDFLKVLNLVIKEENLYDFKNLKEKITCFLLISKEIKQSCNKIIKLISSAGEVRNDDLKIIQKEENCIFTDSQKNEVARVISSSAQDIIISIMENFNYSQDEKKSGWIKTKILYEAIVELAEFYSKNFNKLLKIIENNPNLINVRME